MDEIRLPRVVEKIIDRLEAAGFEAYAVGGCVRDSLLGRQPEDWDITTSARPEEVKRVFPRTVDTGIEHGTVTVMMGGEDSICDGVRGYEVTTYRIDGAYLDGRHPSSVAFTPSLEEDLARRDFTINAMAYNSRTGLVDVFGGREDLKRGLIRAVGRAEHRFTEDALRMLRALRFSAQLGFRIEDETFEAVRALALRLAQVSKERVAVELTKLLMSAHPNRMRPVFDTGLAPYICMDFGRIEMRDVQTVYVCPEAVEHTRERADTYLQLDSRVELAGQNKRSSKGQKAQQNGHASAQETGVDAAVLVLGGTQKTDAGCIPWLPALGAGKKYLVWGTFLRGVPGLSKKILRELKLDNDTIRQAETLAGLFREPFPQDEAAARRLLSRVGYALCFSWLDAAELLAERDALSDGVQKVRRARTLAETVQARGDCIGLKQLAVNGQDLTDAGVEKGPALGQLLNSMLDEVLEHPEHNEKAWLMEHFVSSSGLKAGHTKD